MYFIWKHEPDELKPEWRKIAFSKKNWQEEGRPWDSTDKQLSAQDIFKNYKLIGQDIMDIIEEEFDLNIPNLLMKKNDDGEILLEKDFFADPEYFKIKSNIEAYILSLQPNQKKTIQTFKITPSEKKDIEESLISDIFSTDAPRINIIGANAIFNRTESGTDPPPIQAQVMREAIREYTNNLLLDDDTLTKQVELKTHIIKETTNETEILKKDIDLPL
jgi:hypothetical protein